MTEILTVYDLMMLRAVVQGLHRLVKDDIGLRMQVMVSKEGDENFEKEMQRLERLLGNLIEAKVRQAHA